jgi:hypothetical protein
MGDSSRAFLSDILGMRGLRGHPNCGSHGGPNRRLGPERWLPAALQLLGHTRWQKGQPLEILRLCIDVHDACVASGPCFLVTQFRNHGRHHYRPGVGAKMSWTAHFSKGRRKVGQG